MAKFAYPERISGLYTRECVEYRAGTNRRMQKYLDTRLAHALRSEKTFLEPLTAEENLIVPYDVVLDQMEDPFDIIVVSGIKDGACFGFLQQYSRKSSKGETSGKTSLLLNVMGVDVPDKEIPNKPDDIPGKIRRFPARNAKMLSSDMGYVSANQGSLCTSPAKGEQLLAQWDLARHIYRMKFPGYFPGKERTTEGRKYVEPLGEWNCISSDAFADSRKLYEVSTIFILNRRKPATQARVGIRELKHDHSTLKELLIGNPGYYKASGFWDINSQEHDKRAKELVGKIGKDNLPKIIRIDMQPSYGKYPIEEAAEAVLKILK